MSLAGTYDDANIFAKIIRGEMPCVKVFETPSVLAFMDVFPQARGHVLVVSKTSRARNLLDIEADALTEVVGVVRMIAQAVNESLSPDGIMISQFNGAPVGQTVFHLHFHIIPRFANAPLAGHGHGQMADAAELSELAGLISAAII